VRDLRRPLEHLERRDRAHVRTVRLDRVQRVDRYGAVGVAAAPHIELRQLGILRRLAHVVIGVARLPAAPRRQEHDPPVRQIARIKIVVLTKGELTHPRAIYLHLVEVIERLLGQLAFSHLVAVLG